MANRRGKCGNSDFFLGSNITADGDCSHKIIKQSLLGNDKSRQCVEKQRQNSDKSPYSQGNGLDIVFSSQVKIIYKICIVYIFNKTVTFLYIHQYNTWFGTILLSNKVLKSTEKIRKHWLSTSNYI